MVIFHRRVTPNRGKHHRENGTMTYIHTSDTHPWGMIVRERIVNYVVDKNIDGCVTDKRTAAVWFLDVSHIFIRWGFRPSIRYMLFQWAENVWASGLEFRLWEGNLPYQSIRHLWDPLLPLSPSQISSWVVPLWKGSLSAWVPSRGSTLRWPSAFLPSSSLLSRLVFLCDFEPLFSQSPESFSGRIWRRQHPALESLMNDKLMSEGLNEWGIEWINERFNERMNKRLTVSVEISES